MNYRLCSLSVLLSFLLIPSAGLADTLKVAVAANFAKPLEQFATAYNEKTGNRVIVSKASSGTLYAQINHGADIDVFLSADSSRPQQLLEDGRVNASDVVTYAIGRLGYIQRSNASPDVETLKTFALAPTTRLAIANPRLAPYGEAARQALTSLVLWQHVSGALVYGNNVLQVYQFYQSGNVDHALLAWSLIKGEPGAVQLSDELHQPIVQQLAITATGADKAAANAFVDYLLSDEVQTQLPQWGYQRTGTRE
ncbi:molybdate ABC transporter substrate-binding protein [Alteromonas halophila]|uniref:Molybdate ABC transporter substrate-binding protein n=1 Tax=Alteromonas halophila TaxID=516698 RepID=A0A918JP57_9ALTE|nr:molybdate ABC transporter substrate-binding protein [Alteromonas halophila]GGW89658.1 molybdate ABC transporter substrate-binding protein [Alteromonas halophila]